MKMELMKTIANLEDVIDPIGKSGTMHSMTSTSLDLEASDREYHACTRRTNELIFHPPTDMTMEMAIYMCQCACTPYVAPCSVRPRTHVDNWCRHL